MSENKLYIDFSINKFTYRILHFFSYLLGSNTISSSEILYDNNNANYTMNIQNNTEFQIKELRNVIRQQNEEIEFVKRELVKLQQQKQQQEEEEETISLHDYIMQNYHR